MSRWLLLTTGLVLSASFVLADPPAPAAVAAVKSANSRVTHVTIYQANALVTREVDVPEGTGSLELVVSPLPPQTVASSLYSEGTDGIRVLNTRYRTRATKDDTREEVRKLEDQIKELLRSIQKLQADQKACEQNLAMLTKLEGFTGSTLQHLTDKGLLTGETVITLSKYVMDSRSEKTREMVALQQELENKQEQIQFAQRQMNELATHSSKTEQDAVIVVDKKNSAAGTVRLNYLVDSATWRPQYKFRAGKDKEPVQLEYLAAIIQQTGEDWSNVDLTLSTAEPMLNAAPPDLRMLDIAVAPAGQPAAGPSPAQYRDFDQQSKNLRAQGQQELNLNKADAGGKFINDAAALEQTWDLLASRREDLKKQQRAFRNEGPSVTYHLKTKLSVPSRNDEHVIEVARMDMMPDYYYKAVPVLTPHVYRLANFTNKSEHVLLPGEATMYIGTDYVGRTQLPLVAVGEQFTAGFGVDPQLQVDRQMVDKTQTTQGGNQVLKFDYRILISSYKTEPVKLQLWDRLPHAETTSVLVTLGTTPSHELSKDPLYLREERTKNLIRWDLTVKPDMNGEKAMTVTYDFKLELDKTMRIGTFVAK